MTDDRKSRAELIAEMRDQGKPDLVTNRPPSSPLSSGPSPSPGLGVEALRTPLPGAQRFQYAVVNIGTFSNADRMRSVLSSAGEAGWELVTIYDKASNWVGGWEKGFMLLKRPVPDDVSPSSWCLLIRG